MYIEDMESNNLDRTSKYLYAKFVNALSEQQYHINTFLNSPL